MFAGPDASVLMKLKGTRLSCFMANPIAACQPATSTVETIHTDRQKGQLSEISFACPACQLRWSVISPPRGGSSRIHWLQQKICVRTCRLQNRASNVLAIDIHPAEQFGNGNMIDHGECEVHVRTAMFHVLDINAQFNAVLEYSEPGALGAGIQ